MTVAPGTAASAAALTFAAVVPVSSVSPGPWASVAGSGAGFVAAAVPPAELAVDVDVEPVAAPARPAAPRATPAVSAPVMSHFRARLGLVSIVFAPCWGVPAVCGPQQDAPRVR